MNNEILYKSNNVSLLNNNNSLFFVIDTTTYHLSSHPYEPCLFLKLDNKIIITIHNSFTVDEILNVSNTGNYLELISGNTYNIGGICNLLLCAINHDIVETDITYLEGLLVIDYLEENDATSNETAIDISSFGIKNKNIMNVFTHSKKVKMTHDGKFFKYSKNSNQKQNTTITELINDPFYDEYKMYTECVLDYCILKNNTPYTAIKSHKEVVLFTMEKWRKYFKKAYDIDIFYYEEKMKATKINSDTFFEIPLSKNQTSNNKSYFNLFINPPHRSNYTAIDFYKINNLLFPNGFNNLEIYEWSTDWSNYFDDGLEWWGARCISIYDKTLCRYVVIGASATD